MMSCDGCVETLKVSAVGERFDHDVVTGRTWGPFNATMYNPDPPDGDGEKVDLTGCTITGIIKKKSTDVAAVLEFTATIADQVTNKGEYSWQVSDEDMADVEGGATLRDIAARHVWELILEDITGRKHQLYYGSWNALKGLG
jgi:hypothetical protein